MGADYGVVDDVSGMTYYAAGHEILIFGGGHGATQTDVVYGFDFFDLQWKTHYTRTPDSQMIDDSEHLDSEHFAWINRDNPPERRPLSRHTFDWIAIDENHGHLLMFMRGGYSNFIDGTGGYFNDGDEPETRFLPRYDITGREWSWIDDTAGTDEVIPPTGFGGAAAEFDPVSGNTVIVGQAHWPSNYASGIWVYDPTTERTAHVMEVPANTINVDTLVYFPANQRFYSFWSAASRVGGDPNEIRVFEIELDRTNPSNSTLTEVLDMVDTPGWSYDARGFAADTVNDIIGGVVQDGLFHAYNPLTKQWTTRSIVEDSDVGATIGEMSHFAIAFDRVNGVFIFLGDGAGPTSETRHTWAYRYSP